MFFKFNEEMRQIFLEDIDKHNILSWIIYKTNYQKQFGSLSQYQCYITTRNIASDTKIAPAKVQRILKILESEGFISYVKKSKSKHESSIIYAEFIAKHDTVTDTLIDTVSNTIPDTVKSFATTNIDDNHDTVAKSVTNTVNNTVVDTSSKNNSNIYSRVIAKLNEKACKNFRDTSKHNIALIQARLDEGFQEEDFYTVIDIKCNSWLHDERFSLYLRPSTLFGKNFEAYLNEQHPKVKQLKGRAL